ncbi:putative O-methyltransferase [Chaetomium strumarium]|uniref:O-methyltransferase n=1 Tax=Chaetomium strumarium TaxID=1170767 RepID=A0AAJ0GPU2_9PEZI|nr:putative O-methyltransferase [Chaetomium strumarium]
MEPPQHGQSQLVRIAEDILSHTKRLVSCLSDRSSAPPTSLEVGAHSELWVSDIHDGGDSTIEQHRNALRGLVQQLEKLVEGPHGFLHEYVSTNWEHGALYALLEFGILEQIPLDGAISIAQLAERRGHLPSEKLLRVCRLVACAGILKETEEGVFAHTAISEELVRDAGFRSWVAFQLYETRVASAHLADSLRQSNPFWEGQSAFEYAWGLPMYDWHAKHPRQGQRFAEAMESVSKNLDPGNSMILSWFSAQSGIHEDETALVVDVAGKTGSFAAELARSFPKLKFEVQDSSETLLRRGQESLQQPLTNRVIFRQRELFAMRSFDEHVQGEELLPRVFLLRSVLWCLNDESCIRLLRSFIPALQHASRPALLINDLVSPVWGTFEPHIERAFRRRDVTVMTMHNAKQRTSAEWDALFRAASDRFRIEYREAYSSHSCRGLWTIQLDATDAGGRS